jgi:plastocyanin
MLEESVVFAGFSFSSAPDYASPDEPAGLENAARRRGRPCGGSVARCCAQSCSRQETKPAAGASTPAKTVTGAQTYTIAVDHPSPDGKQEQFSAFYPRSVRVRPGDTVVFDNRSTHSIHTVTFGVKADQSNQPHPVSKGEANPAVFAPCFMPSDPTADMMACQTSPRGLDAPGTGGPPAAPAYTGQGYWSSGVVAFAISGQPSPPPAEAAGRP